MAVKNNMDAEGIIRAFKQLPEETKDMVLRKNVFNIGPASLEDIGYSIVSFPRMDFEYNISMTLRKPAKLK